MPTSTSPQSIPRIHLASPSPAAHAAPRCTAPAAARRRLAFLAGLLVASGACGAEVPAYCTAALAGFRPDVPPGWAYTLAVTRGNATSVESFDPSQRSGRQWALVRRDGRAPTAGEAERYLRYRETTNATSGARATFARGDLDYSSAQVVREDAAGVTLRYLFRSDAVEPMLTHLELYLAVGKLPAVVQRSTLRLIQPYSPVFGMTMDDLEVEMTFSPPGLDHPGLPRAARSRFRGRLLWFWSIEEVTRVTYANYRRVVPSVGPAAPP